MSTHNPVPLDAAEEIKELALQGVGRNQISAITGVPASTVRNILGGEFKTFTDKLTPRQVQALLNRAFPIGR